MPKTNLAQKKQHMCRLNKEKLEETLVNMIDARGMFEEALEEIKRIQRSNGYWTDKKKIKQVDIIKTAMWQVWSTKELEEGLHGSADGNIDDMKIVPILERAKEDTSRVMSMEISGPDGGPLEVIRRISQQDLERLRPFTAMIKQEQRGRLIGQRMIEDGK